jgi:hypothetical protein
MSLALSECHQRATVVFWPQIFALTAKLIKSRRGAKETKSGENKKTSLSRTHTSFACCCCHSSWIIRLYLLIMMTGKNLLSCSKHPKVRFGCSSTGLFAFSSISDSKLPRPSAANRVCGLSDFNRLAVSQA